MAVDAVVSVDRRWTLVGALAALAPVADVAGRVLAPTLLGTAPLAVLVLSPSDPHMVLSDLRPVVLLAAVVVGMRVGRAWIVFRGAGDLARLVRPGRLRRMLLPARGGARSRRVAAGSVVLLPTMAGAVVAARARLDARLYFALLASSTTAGVALSLGVAALFEDQVGQARVLVLEHSALATVVVLLVGAAVTVRRLRVGAAPVSRGARTAR